MKFLWLNGLWRGNVQMIWCQQSWHFFEETVIQYLIFRLYSQMWGNTRKRERWCSVSRLDIIILRIHVVVCVGFSLHIIHKNSTLINSFNKTTPNTKMKFSILAVAALVASAEAISKPSLTVSSHDAYRYCYLSSIVVDCCRLSSFSLLTQI
jgi:hypothetical protein